MSGITLVGLLAAVCTTGSFLPQAIKTWRTRHVADLSLVMYVVLCTGVALWLAYGLLISDVPIVVANVVTLVLAGSILVAIVVDRMHRSPRAVTIEVEATDAADGDTGEAQP
ncbi:MAG: SemiSWEET family sugar transporter [Actinobacteria bacterium]|nr:SemiSWEET family sugar transporter [Actinomycetota bacterium]